MKTINGFDVIATQEEINKAIEALGNEFTKDELDLFLVQLREEQEQTELQTNAKQQKQLALDSIIVTTTSGKQFDGREKDQIRMLSVLQASAVLNTTSTLWKMADNTVAEITVDELKEALALSIQKVGEIILGGTQ